MRQTLLLLSLVVAGCSWLPWPPNPQPTPTPEPPPAWECELPMPECGEVDQTCSTPESPCWHNPTSNPEHCEEAPACPPPPPACPEECPEGQHCIDPEVGCVPKPVEPPPSEDCPFATPTAAWMQANGYSCEVKPMREGRKGIGATPKCQRWPDVDGQPYYCQPGLWPEACAAGRISGPVAPDGHPARVACEQHFLQLPCAYFTYTSSEHMSFDPFVVINSVNQNHPRNVEVCGQAKFGSDPSWEKDEQGYIKAGQWSWATAHGNGIIHASAKDGVARGSLVYEER